MINFSKKIPPFILLSLSLLAGCSTLPDGPGVLVLPGTGKDFEHFRADDTYCQQTAMGQLTKYGKQPDSYQQGQQSYDVFYIQCMYSKGHKVPVPSEMSFNNHSDWHAPPPPNLPAPSAGSQTAPQSIQPNP